jgi:hypothetical protein
MCSLSRRTTTTITRHDGAQFSRCLWHVVHTSEVRDLRGSPRGGPVLATEIFVLQCTTARAQEP